MNPDQVNSDQVNPGQMAADQFGAPFGAAGNTHLRVTPRYPNDGPFALPAAEDGPRLTRPRSSARALPAVRRWRFTIGRKLGLLTGALVAIMAISTAALIGQTRSTALQYDTILANEGQQTQLALHLEVEFKKEVQEWKDILLRGSNPDDLATYTGNLRKQQMMVGALYDQLIKSDANPQLRADLLHFHQLQSSVDTGYAKALPVFVASGGKDFRTVDRQVRGIDRPATDQLDVIVSGIQTRITKKLVQQQDAVRDRQRATLIIAGLLLTMLIVALTVALIRIVRPIRRLTREAFTAASDRLPGAIAAIKHLDVGSEPVALPAFRVETHDELRELGQALTSLQESALTLAAEQHRADRENADMLINLGRRNQNLLGRLLSYVTALERQEQNPEILAQLFQLDHAATRIRRNAESMLVLAGATQTRTWSRPVPCIDVVRAALSEIEEYTRVDLHHIEDGTVTGTAVADVVHLIAELVENATHFSPPNTQVTVIGQRIRDGYRIRVIDQGVGMTRRELDEANQRISNSDAGWSDAKLLGLYVVGRLARRRGIAVTLEPSAGRGITATILLAPALLGSAFEAKAPAGRSSTVLDQVRSSRLSAPVPAGSNSLIDVTALEGRSAQPLTPVGVPSQWYADPFPNGAPALGQASVSRPPPVRELGRPATRVGPVGDGITSGITSGINAGIHGGVRDRGGSAAVAIPRRVRGAQLPDLGPAPDPVIARSEDPTAAPESLRWQLRSFQLDVEAARRAIAEHSQGSRGEPAPSWGWTPAAPGRARPGGLTAPEADPSNEAKHAPLEDER